MFDDEKRYQEIFEQAQEAERVAQARLVEIRTASQQAQWDLDEHTRKLATLPIDQVKAWAQENLILRATLETLDNQMWEPTQRAVEKAEKARKTAHLEFVRFLNETYGEKIKDLTFERALLPLDHPKRLTMAAEIEVLKAAHKAKAILQR